MEPFSAHSFAYGGCDNVGDNVGDNVHISYSLIREGSIRYGQTTVKQRNRGRGSSSIPDVIP